MAEVETSDGMVLVENGEPTPCSMALEASEAIDLAQQLIAAAITVEPPAEAAAKLSRT